VRRKADWMPLSLPVPHMTYTKNNKNIHKEGQYKRWWACGKWGLSLSPMQWLRGTGSPAVEGTSLQEIMRRERLCGIQSSDSGNLRKYGRTERQ